MTACSWGRCKAARAPVVVELGERYCRTHARMTADRVVGQWVKDRDGRCLRCASTDRLQWAHIHTRGMRHIRYVTEPYPGGSVTLCAGCHFAYTLRPDYWRNFIGREFPGHWDALLRIEDAGQAGGGSVDVADVIRTYRSRRPPTIVTDYRKGARRV